VTKGPAAANLLWRRSRAAPIIPGPDREGDAIAVEIQRAFEEQPVHSVDSLAALLPDFPRDAIEQALEALTAAGVLAVEGGESGERRYRYYHPERYRLINAPLIRQPGPDFGKR